VKRDTHIAETGETLQFEHPVGKQTFLEYKFPLRDAYDKIFAIGGISLEITEKLEAQKLIAENEERLRNLTDNLPNGVVYKYVVNAEGQIDSFPYVSSGCTSVLGYTPEEIRENPMILFQQVDQEMIPAMMQVAENSRQTLDNFEFEYRITTKTGETKWVQTRSKPKRLANGFTEWGGLTLDITERKKAEDEIKKASERFTTVANATNDVIWDWNLITDEIWWNDNYFNSFGFQAGNQSSEITSWTSHVHAEDVDRVVEGIHRAIEKGERNWSDEYRFVTNEGKEVFIYDRGFVMYDESGKPYRMIGSMQDVTDQKKAQQELQKVYDELNAILNASTDTTFFLDNHHTIRLFNQSARDNVQKIYGRQVQVGDNIMDYIPTNSELQEDFQKNFDRALKGEKVNVERRVKFTESFSQWSSIRYLPVFDHQSNVIGVSFNTSDITQRKNAELELIASKSEYQRLVHMIPVGVFKNGKLANGDSKFLYVSPRWCELNDVDESAVLQDFSLALQKIHPDDLATLWKVALLLFAMKQHLVGKVEE
jgi:PAS domain S-box